MTRKGVNLQFVHVEKFDKQCGAPGLPGSFTYPSERDTDGIYMPGGKWFARIWTAPRVPCGIFGPWVVFRYNGEEHVPDLSCPISISKLPRDAKPMGMAECLEAWSK